MTKAIYKLYVDYGRMGDIEGLFIADKEVVEKHKNKTVYLGEVLGKHSEVYFDLDENYLTMVSDDQAFIEKLQEVLNVTSDISGYNPINYIEEREAEAESEEAAA